MQAEDLVQGAVGVAEQAGKVANMAADLAVEASKYRMQEAANAVAKASESGNDFWLLFTIFVLACFVGYYVVWKVTPALHAPLMSVSNAISGIVIVGAIVAAGSADFTGDKFIALIGVVLASINIFGGFVVSQRMLAMFKKKKKQEAEGVK